ncbi:PAXNEB protein [Cooperia oncophora]
MNLNDIARLKGCVLKGRSLETSCGCSAVDSLLGGALPISTFFCVDELNSRGYAESLAKYFIAEGLYSGHDVLVVDPLDGDKLWKGIPTRIEAQPASTSTSPLLRQPDSPEDLRIAFRYAAKPQVNSSIGEKNRYDLGKPLDTDAFVSQILGYDGPTSYDALYEHLVDLCRSETYSTTRGPKKNLLRIVINHLGSPAWNDPSNFSAFLVRIRPLLRKSYVVLFATIESETMFKKHSEELFVTADVYIQLVAISEEEQKKLSSLDKYHGYLRILRLPRITSVGTHNPPVDLVFTQKRNTFDVSILHLPPAVADGDHSSKAPCNIDF